MYYSFCMYIPFYTFFLIVIFKSFNLFSVNSTNIQFNSFYTFKTFSPFSLYIPYVYLYTFLPYISFYLLSPNLTFYIFYPFKIYRIYLTDIQYISKKQNKKNACWPKPNKKTVGNASTMAPTKNHHSKNWHHEIYIQKYMCRHWLKYWILWEPMHHNLIRSDTTNG